MRRLLFGLALLMSTPVAAEPVRLAAAGSLRAALAEVATAFAAAPSGARVTETYVRSGILRQRLGAGDTSGR